jgi:hypothetical protein
MGGGSQLVQAEPDHIGKKEEQSSARGLKASRGQGEGTCIGYGFDGGTGSLRAFLVETARERGKAFRLEHLADGGGTQRELLLLEGLADLIDRVVLLA